MSLTLQQEQTVSSLLHYILNSTEHHDGFMANSILAIVQVIDADIVSQSGTVYNQPSGPGTLDGTSGAQLGGPPGS